MTEEEDMYVITRTGKREPLDTNQITLRLKTLANRSPKILHVNAHELMLKVCETLKSGITTYQIDEYTANVAASLGLVNPYYLVLAGRLAIDNHQKTTMRSFTDKMRHAYLNKDEENKPSPLISQDFFKFVETHQDAIENMIDYSRDFELDFLGIRTFQKNYSIKVNDSPVERPQDMFMREAIQVTNLDNDITTVLSEIKETYDLLSRKYYTHASPTLFNSGGNRQQLASCFLLGTEDSIEGIEHTGSNASLISKWAGGIGIHVNSWRSTGAKIRGTNGRSSGIVPFLRTYETRMLAFNQGGRRPGSAAIYLMPHHPDLMKFLSIVKKTGIEKERARDLFTALWIPDIFMERVRDGKEWSFFDPQHCGDLSVLYGKRYRERYLELEKAGMAKGKMSAQEIWNEIHAVKSETGLPYICFSDSANCLSNHKNIGTIKSSNLCAEVYLYSDSKEYATCVLSSIGLPMFVTDSYSEEEETNAVERRELNHEFPRNPVFDFKKLISVVKVIVRNLNNVVDKTYSPVVEAKRGNERHRPIGIGVQGLADVYSKMRYAFDSEEAMRLNKHIFETIYYAAVTMSSYMCRKEYQKLSKKCRETGSVTVTKFSPDDYETHKVTYTSPSEIPKRVAAYSSIDWNGGSPIGKGIFHWELAGLKSDALSGMFDWESTRQHVLEFGVKNSLLVAIMPTATTSQVLGNNECIEPYTSNFYNRDLISGQFTIIKKYLIHDLYELGIWNKNLRDYILASKDDAGSIQHIDGIPDEIKALHKTSREIDQKVLVQQAIDRQPFVDQGQSLNLYTHILTKTLWTDLMFQAWQGGLKTGCYYMHTRPAVPPQKFTIDPRKQQEMAEIVEKMKRERGNVKVEKIEQICEACGS